MTKDEFNFIATVNRMFEMNLKMLMLLEDADRRIAANNVKMLEMEARLIKILETPGPRAQVSPSQHN